MSAFDCRIQAGNRGKLRCNQAELTQTIKAAVDMFSSISCWYPEIEGGMLPSREQSSFERFMGSHHSPHSTTRMRRRRARAHSVIGGGDCRTILGGHTSQDLQIFWLTSHFHVKIKSMAVSIEPCKTMQASAEIERSPSLPHDRYPIST